MELLDHKIIHNEVIDKVLFGKGKKRGMCGKRATRSERRASQASLANHQEPKPLWPSRESYKTTRHPRATPPPPTAPHPLPLATCAGFPSPQSAMWAVPHPRPRPRPSTPPHTELYKLTLLTTLSVALTLHLISSHLLL